MASMNRVGLHKTTIAHDGTHTIVTYHNTQVAKFSEREVILNSGGYQTATTKARMNQAARQFDLPYRLYQENFVWYIDLVYGDKILSTRIPYRDGMTIKIDSRRYPVAIH